MRSLNHDCLLLILSIAQEDSRTLFNTLIVSRAWFLATVDILFSRPFSLDSNPGKGLSAFSRSRLLELLVRCVSLSVVDKNERLYNTSNNNDSSGGCDEKETMLPFINYYSFVQEMSGTTEVYNCLSDSLVKTSGDTVETENNMSDKKLLQYITLFAEKIRSISIRLDQFGILLPLVHRFESLTTIDITSMPVVVVSQTPRVSDSNDGTGTGESGTFGVNNGGDDDDNDDEVSSWPDNFDYRDGGTFSSTIIAPNSTDAIRFIRSHQDLFPVVWRQQRTDNISNNNNAKNLLVHLQKQPVEQQQGLGTIHVSPSDQSKHWETFVLLQRALKNPTRITIDDAVKIFGVIREFPDQHHLVPFASQSLLKKLKELRVRNRPLDETTFTGYELYVFPDEDTGHNDNMNTTTTTTVTRTETVASMASVQQQQRQKPKTWVVQLPRLLMLCRNLHSFELETAMPNDFQWAKQEYQQYEQHYEQQQQRQLQQQNDMYQSTATISKPIPSTFIPLRHLDLKGSFKALSDAMYGFRHSLEYIRFEHWSIRFSSEASRPLIFGRSQPFATTTAREAINNILWGAIESTNNNNHHHHNNNNNSRISSNSDDISIDEIWTLDRLHTLQILDCMQLDLDSLTRTCPNLQELSIKTRQVCTARSNKTKGMDLAQLRPQLNNDYSNNNNNNNNNDSDDDDDYRHDYESPWPRSVRKLSVFGPITTTRSRFIKVPFPAMRDFFNLSHLQELILEDDSISLRSWETIFSPSVQADLVNLKHIRFLNLEKLKIVGTWAKNLQAQVLGKVAPKLQHLELVFRCTRSTTGSQVEVVNWPLDVDSFQNWSKAKSSSTSSSAPAAAATDTSVEETETTTPSFKQQRVVVEQRGYPTLRRLRLENCVIPEKSEQVFAAYFDSTLTSFSSKGYSLLGWFPGLRTLELIDVESKDFLRGVIRRAMRIPTMDRVIVVVKQLKTYTGSLVGKEEQERHDTFLLDEWDVKPIMKEDDHEINQRNSDKHFPLKGRNCGAMLEYKNKQYMAKHPRPARLIP